MRHLTQSDYLVMPWKNGGGMTTEIAVFPAPAANSGGAFLWRISIADVARDGPFSRFPGFDRLIMTIEGNGMMLQTAKNGIVDLSKPFVPRSFSGDWDADGRLVSGPVRDFNVIFDRAQMEAKLSCMALKASFRTQVRNGTLVCHLLEGEAICAGRIVVATDTLIFGRGESVELTPLDRYSRLAIVELTHAPGDASGVAY